MWPQHRQTFKIVATLPVLCVALLVNQTFPFVALDNCCGCVVVGLFYLAKWTQQALYHFCCTIADEFIKPPTKVPSMRKTRVAKARRCVVVVDVLLLGSSTLWLDCGFNQVRKKTASAPPIHLNTEGPPPPLHNSVFQGDLITGGPIPSVFSALPGLIVRDRIAYWHGA
jgi:hypothetical protein